MSGHGTSVQPRRPPAFENEGLDHAQLCIRVMERFFAEVHDDPDLRTFNNLALDLWLIYSEVLEEELGSYVFKLALELFSENHPLAKQRRAMTERQTGTEVRP